MKSGHLIVDDLDVHYAEQGQESVVLLLHGWGTSLVTFNELISAWGDKGKRFITLDLPGFGGSEAPPVAWDVSAYASFVQNFLVKLGIDELQVVIGHSLGGRIAIKGVTEGKFRPKQLVLIASAGTASTHSARSALYMIIVKMGRALTNIPPLSLLREQLRKGLYKVAGSSDYLNAGYMKETFLKIVRENLTEDARKIKIPSLLVWGENDTETPLIEGRTLRGAIRDSKLDIISGAGHFVHQEKPKEVAERIVRFTEL
jgi:pimeloyl-ACP methyl ester carboxylesterase